MDIIATIFYGRYVFYSSYLLGLLRKCGSLCCGCSIKVYGNILDLGIAPPFNIE